MVNSEKRQSANGQRIDDVDPADETTYGKDLVNVSSSCAETSARANQPVMHRLTEILVGDEDGDLLLQRSDGEDGFFQWLCALDMQVMGACRADERLKPLLKLNVSIDVAEDRLLAQLSQHFEPAEVGILARCLCIPLVSIRVGKINKQGALLSPTSVRGNLCLTLLPTSDLRLSFNGDDSCVERLATFSTEGQSSRIDIEEISADKSGRSFLIKTSDSVLCYFWCSEKSKLLGSELLRKMKDLLMQKPSLAELTGISDSRLNCFATHLQAYLTGSMLTCAHASGILSAIPSDDSVDSSVIPQSSFNYQKSAHFQPYCSQASKTSLMYQSSLSPRSSSSTESLQRNFSIGSAAGEKLRRCESFVSSLDNTSLTSSNSTDPSVSACNQKDKPPEVKGIDLVSSMNILDVLGISVGLPHAGQEVQVPSSGPSPFTPHYCWCPPVASALQCTMGNPQLPISSTESLSVPQLSPFLLPMRPSILSTSKPLLNLVDIPAFDIPSLPTEPLVRFPTSQQIPTFTPFICDPIVHTPVVDVCSSVQGYFVNSGPGISTTVPPLNPNLVDPLLPSAESVVEKGARETLRMLINGSNQPDAHLLEVLPSVLSGSSDKEHALVAGSRGFYCGSRDVDTVMSNVSTMGLALSSECGGSSKRCASSDDLIDQVEKTSSSDPCCFDGETD